MDMRTLIAAQRVCHAWADMIRTSCSLQEALFLLPARNNRKDESRVYNPLLAKSFPSIFPTEDLRELAGDRMEEIELGRFDLMRNSTIREIYLRPEASWRRMLTQHPPIYTIGEFASFVGHYGLSWHQDRTTRQEEGLRMGTFFEWLVGLGLYRWNGESIKICLGGSVPLNTPLEIHERIPYLDIREINADWRVMSAGFDLVLVASSGGTCMDYEEPGDPDWIKSPNEIAWEEICEGYRELGLSMVELQMVRYKEGSSMW
ncbi:hypothetical protein N7457_006608 [Penicillium paradoxum]|uniref:uncharacterized protein n=1 Tax=Penicillium paradoxum TaxID=176176 RepID=UPI002546DDF0|nr:uncharacterized protein N7457_006608 [Penicillium paradoxum]KAJ5778888.1 hypothetical protein N7457_006608 [Penicillium paradoxum]